MEENNVILSIRGMQLYADAEPETIELVTEGKLDGNRKEGFTLTYEESELTGLEGTRTTFRIEKDKITLLRIGAVNSQMVFEAGRRHLSMYDTPQGALSVGIDTRRMSADIRRGAGSIEIDYAIEIDHAVTGQNFFHINIKKKGKGLPS
ncbi:MAG: DUF1934 domain-containing protein [Oscillospiraceae bacterium]|nr:DUF1934 domain-containing protein [Oscillospiraceae bacterium]